MKGLLELDPRERDFGVATDAVRAILIAWSEIDWFEPGGASDVDAEAWFRDHQRLAHGRDPAAFPVDLDVRCVHGTRDDFAAWCARVRGETGWDWKYGALKRLSNEHAKAHGWAPERVAPAQGITPGPGELWFTLVHPNGHATVIWNNVMPKLEGLDDACGFYLSYAHGDVLDCVRWRIAEGRDELTGNPFLPLLHGYAGGSYPFSLSRDEVVLFRFV